MRDDAQVAALAAALGDASVDVLVNNAGVAGSWNTTLATFDAEEALRCFDTNALGAIRVTRALLPNLRAARGKIINITSRMGSIGDNGSGRGYAYRMSKAALNMATRNIAHEVKGFGGIAVALHPGWVKTEMGGEGGDGGDRRCRQAHGGRLSTASTRRRAGGYGTRTGPSFRGENEKGG